MLIITTSPKYIQEKSYIISVLFGEILGLAYRLQFDENQLGYNISFENKSLLIEDHFFRMMNGDLSYLSEENIPTKITYGANKFCPENNIPIIFGYDKCIVEDSLCIKCAIDVFSSAFFLLSRWEEYAISKRDKFDRFQATESLAGKENILSRPTVNEYVEMLWNMLQVLGYKSERKKLKFEFIATHDIDQPIRLANMQMLAKSFTKNLFVFKDFLGGFFDIPTYVLNKFYPKYDLAYSYEFLIQCSEQVGIKSIFNFQNSIKTKYDWGYKNSTRRMRDIFNIIKDSGHIIGFHPSYYSYNNFSLWKKEYDELCNKTDTKIKIGRQHYLRFKVPDTWQIWDENFLEFDTTLGYAEKEGFRCGTCTPFSVFNILTRKQLKLKEMPLILMDKTIMSYQKNSGINEFLNKTKNLIFTTKKYNGTFVFLWHNSSFDRKKYTKDFYKKIIDSHIDIY